MVTIVDPHLKRDDNYGVYKEAHDNGLAIKNKDGGDFDGWCWPGKEGMVEVWLGCGRGLGRGGGHLCLGVGLGFCLYAYVYQVGF